MDKIDQQPIWYNSKIQIQHKVIFYKTWVDAGIQYIKDLKDDRGIMLRYDQFCATYQGNINFMQFLSVVSVIPRVWNYNRNIAQSLNQVHHIEKLFQSIKPSKVAYAKLINQTVQFPTPLEEKWKQELDYSSLDQL